MPREWFNCWQCGRTKANEYSECAYCGGDVEIIDGEAQMIDIESMDRDALIAEIRRLLGISSTPQAETKWFVEGKEHRKCPLCSNDEMFVGTETGNETRNWVQCTRCGWYARSGDRRRK